MRGRCGASYSRKEVREGASSIMTGKSAASPFASSAAPASSPSMTTSAAGVSSGRTSSGTATGSAIRGSRESCPKAGLVKHRRIHVLELVSDCGLRESELEELASGVPAKTLLTSLDHHPDAPRG